MDRTDGSRHEQARLEDDPLWAEAAAWFIELRSEHVSSERIAEWLRWLDEDARHQQAFDGIVSLRGQGRQLQARWPSESEVAADDYTGDESITAWRERSRALSAPSASSAAVRGSGPVSSPGRRRHAAMAAAVALAVIALLGWRFGPTVSAALQGGKRLAFATDVGEIRTLTLPDGSLVTAGGQTSLVAIALKHSRQLILDRGEIFLRVAKDHTRPFTVRAGGASVIAVGTAFDVRRIKTEAVVAVAEGVVRVSAAGESRSDLVASAGPSAAGDQTNLVRAGQQWRLDGSGGAAQVTSVDPDAVAGWREGRLQYLDEPLALVIADLARYSSRAISLKDERVGQMRMTGVVFPHDIDAWLASLEVSLPVRVQHQADGRIEIEQK